MRPVQGMQAWRAQAGTAGHWTPNSTCTNYLQQTGWRATRTSVPPSRI